MKTRMEYDSMGPIEVPKEAWWGRKPNEVAKILRLAVKKCHRNYCVLLYW